MRAWLYRRWRRFLAFYRLDMTAVCEESRGMGDVDYHDYPDDALGSFMCHMVKLKCVRCGKEFTV